MGDPPEAAAYHLISPPVATSAEAVAPAQYSTEVVAEGVGI